MNTKLNYITNLRVFATIMVILIHTSGGGLLRFTSIPHDWWWICNIVNGSGKFSVPIFVMISGALLLGKEIDILSFLQKRFLRVWLPFTVWVIISVLYNNFFEYHTIALQKAFTDYLTMGAGNLYGHFWFIYMLLGLYLITPFLNYFVLKAKPNEVYFFLFLCFVSSSFFPLIKEFTGISIRLDLQNFGGYIGYFVAGYFLKNSNLKLNKWIYVAGFLVGYGVTISGYYLLISPEGKTNPYFYNYLSPNVILMSLCIFMFFKDVLNKEIYPKIMTPLDNASFGIYLSHYLIITILSHKIFLNWAWHPPLIGIFTHAGLTLIIAFILTWSVSKLPKGHWIMG